MPIETVLVSIFRCYNYFVLFAQEEYIFLVVLDMCVKLRARVNPNCSVPCRELDFLVWVQLPLPKESVIGAIGLDRVECFLDGMQH